MSRPRLIGGLRERLPDGARLAVGTLTAFPVPVPRRITPPVPAQAMLLAPLAGLIPGLAALAVGQATLTAGGTRELAAASAVAALALTTRGLHLDGLADTADGLAGSYDRHRALEVMRRGNTGPAGAATLVLVLLVQVLALAQALQAGAVVLLVVAVAGRCGLAAVCRRGVPAARPEGLGALVAGSVPHGWAIVGVLLSAAGCAALGMVAGLPWWAGPAAVAAGVLVGLLTAARAVLRLGGITGDVLGAVVETGTAAAAVVLACGLAPLTPIGG